MSLPLIHRMRRSAWALPLALLAALVIVGINEAAYDRSTRALEGLAGRAEARAQIQRVWRSLIEAESGQRGYLITGRQEHLEPYSHGVASAREALDWLARHHAGDAEAEPVLSALQRSSQGKLSELATTLQQHEAGSGAWRELMLTDIGREQMEVVRASSAQLLALHTQRLGQERGDVLATLRNGRIGVSAITLLALMALLVFLRRTLAFDAAQQRHALALQAERDRLRTEAEHRTAALTGLARHLQDEREDERGRLARELHDELGALLTAAKLDAARLKRALGEPAGDLQARLVHLNGSINRGIDFKRRIIEELRPSSLSNLGLVAALEILTREHAAHTGVPVQALLEPVQLTDSAQTTAYRLVQEALGNAARHAGARHLRVVLRSQARAGREGARLEVEDDGRGFDPEARRGSTHGLMGLRYRVEAEGGAMQVHAQPGQGARIEAWLPQIEATAEEAPVTVPAVAAWEALDRVG